MHSSAPRQLLSSRGAEHSAAAFKCTRVQIPAHNYQAANYTSIDLTWEDIQKEPSQSVHQKRGGTWSQDLQQPFGHYNLQFLTCRTYTSEVSASPATSSAVQLTTSVLDCYQRGVKRLLTEETRTGSACMDYGQLTGTRAEAVQPPKKEVCRARWRVPATQAVGRCRPCSAQ